MKIHMDGFEIECTVEEFLKMQDVIEPKEKKDQKTPYQELQDLKHWVVKEVEVENGKEMTATLVSTHAKKEPTSFVEGIWNHYYFDGFE